MNSQAFQPSWISPPGDTILDILSDREITPKLLADSMGCELASVELLFDGSAEITEQLAHRLSAVIGPDPEFWIVRERQYREDVSRIYRDVSQSEESWLLELPVKSMQAFGWISKSESKSKKVIDCLDYFGVPDISAWKDKSSEFVKDSRFRASKSFDQKVGATAAWIRYGEIRALKASCNKWDKSELLESIESIRALTNVSEPSEFIPNLQAILANCGVVLVISRTPEGCPASGMAKFLSEDKALIMLSFRYLSDDHFWFSLFHEIGHLILHGQDSTFVEGEEFEYDREEREANEFAAITLIPPRFRVNMEAHSDNYRSIIKFARSVGIAPGVVVGQMQHFNIVKRNHMNKLKVKYSWSDGLASL